MRLVLSAVNLVYVSQDISGTETDTKMSAYRGNNGTTYYIFMEKTAPPDVKR